MGKGGEERREICRGERKHYSTAVDICVLTRRFATTHKHPIFFDDERMDRSMCLASREGGDGGGRAGAGVTG